jgi:hypothetical protein
VNLKLKTAIKNIACVVKEEKTETIDKNKLSTA